MKAKTVSPIVLNAKAVLGTTLNRALGVDDVERLRNPSRTAILIDQIKFRIDAPTATTALSLAVAIQVRLDLGRMALTAGRFIPLAVLCPILDFTSEIVASGFGPFIGTGATDTSWFAAEFIWQLPKPLYVPAGELLVPQFLLDGELYTGLSGLTAYVTYFGRALASDAPVPDYVNVPFATAWLDSKRVGGANYLAVKSIRSDLKNPCAEDLYVQRMMGSYGVIDTDIGGTNKFSAGTSALGIGNFDGAPIDQIGNDLVLAQIFKSNGMQVAKDKTPWSHLFPFTTRVMDLCCVLKRNEWFQLQTDIKITTFNDTATAANQSVKLMASLIGYRKVAYARGSGFVEAA